MTDNNDKGTGQRRRDFIKLGTAGIIGSLAACSVTPGKEATESAAPVPDRGLSEMDPVPPEVGDIVDPEQLLAETWQEPWTWRPDEWPGDSLELNVVGYQSPAGSPSPGNPNPALYSFNGTSPAPTIRVRNDGELRVRLRNLLDKNHGWAGVGPIPDIFDVPPTLQQKTCTLAGIPPSEGAEEGEVSCSSGRLWDEFKQVTGHDSRPNWDMNVHVNGLHQAHTTNIHSHGLHVFPQTNPDGSHSDNIFLRLMPKADYEARKEKHGKDSVVLMEDEHVGQIDYHYLMNYEHRGERLPHPPGTHWYHPHAHGSTHIQVSSGMAGYLIVEGDVDEAINQRMTGAAWPDPQIPTGDFDFRERLVFVQRALAQQFDLAAPAKKPNLKFPPSPTEKDAKPAEVFRMRPGAVERWRILNGSTDGAGTKRFMVLKGQFVQLNQRIWRVVAEGEGEARKRRLELATEEDFESAKADLHQLSLDGITLVREENSKARHWIKDLSKQNAGTSNPFVPKRSPGDNQITASLKAYESVWKNGDTLRRAFVRPNELNLTNANRADVFFKAPVDAADSVYTIFAKEAHIHTDNLQQRLQGRAHDPNFLVFRDLFDVVVGYIHITGKPVEGGDFDIQSLNAVLPPVPPLLQPVREDELSVRPAEAALTGVPAGSKRTRTISYSGMGAANFPHTPVPESYAREHPELENLTWCYYQGVPIILGGLTGTMGINTDFDLSVDDPIRPPRKFVRHDPYRSRVLVDTAEEWVLYNSSMMLWSHTDRERFPQPGSYGNRYTSYPISRAEGQRRYAEDPEFRISAKANDHPFHIHINPMWVLRIDVPDENGDLHNILPDPVWMDTINIPRNGGRVVFRSRFDDFVGSWINHCHVLFHEDNGMMQEVECTDDPAQANYKPRIRVATHGMSGGEVDKIYPKPSLELMFRQNMTFVDPNTVSPYEFPGFDFEVPKLENT